jgi:hypothetical protein
MGANTGMAVNQVQYGVIDILETVDSSSETVTFTFDWKGDTALISLSSFKDSDLIRHIGHDWIKIGPYDATIVGYHNGCLVVKK